MHPESKLEEDEGVLKRRHIHITALAPCGKEARNIDTQILHIDRPNIYYDEKNLRELILEMTTKEARQKDISRQTLHNLKKYVNASKPLLLKKKILLKLM